MEKNTLAAASALLGGMQIQATDRDMSMPSTVAV